VEVSGAYSSAGGGESFVEGFSAPLSIRRTASSFDEPLASALSGGLDYAQPQGIIPMLPNGLPSHSTSFRNSIPIRTMAGLSDGVGEGIGRIRREIHKARSPPPTSRLNSNMGGRVPLEFDEEDEDFLTREPYPVPPPHTLEEEEESVLARSVDRMQEPLTASLSIPSSHLQPLEPEGEEMWAGWGSEDKQAIEDAERFDNISVTGFLDEEQAAIVQQAKPKPKKKKGKR